MTELNTAAKTALETIAASPEAARTVDVASTVEATSGWISSLTGIVDQVHSVVWGAPLVACVLLTGLVLTCFLRMYHIFNLKKAFFYMFHNDSSKGDVSQFGSLCTALSATIGTGNIVGVATAIGTGGPGALFWMEVAAFFGMATKYAEGLLAVKFRRFTPSGEVLGGPFYYIEDGLRGRFGIRNWKWLAFAFATCGLIAGTFGTGTIAQVHGITSAVQRFFDPAFNPSDMATGVRILDTTYSVPVIIAGALVTVLTALVIIGGLRRIAAVSTVVVPFMAITYVLVIALLLLGNLSKVTSAVELVIRSAFNPSAFTGGMVGSIFIAVQKGVARGIFSNEAGLGSAPIAAAAAQTNDPAKQGLVCMLGTFIDTIIICTLTGLAIVVTGAWEPSLGLEGVDITIEAVERGLSFLGPWSGTLASLFLMTALAFFAFTTILGWNYYAEKCLQYIVGPHRRAVLFLFRVVFISIVFIGPYLTISVVWGAADVFNAMMAFPNLVALILLSPVVWRVTRDFSARERGASATDDASRAVSS